MYSEEQMPTMNICLNIANQADKTVHNYPCTVPFISQSRQLRLNEALEDTCHRVMPLYGAQLFYADFANRTNRFLGIFPFEREVRINYESIINGSIQIIVKPAQRSSRQMKQVNEEQIMVNQTKTKKVKQRTIQQAIQSVKLWRVLYDTDDGKGKRLYTLDQAAQKVGVAKKTLDDYYSLIRTAMNYGFDAERYKQSKVGLLRKFVKIAKEQGQQGINSKMNVYLLDQNIQKYWMDLNDL